MINRLSNLLAHKWKKYWATGVILLYHRVADVSQDPHQLCVSPYNFENQVKWLRNNYSIVSVRAIISTTRKQGDKALIAITFDDGYEDNYTKASKILKKYNIPATIFCTGEELGSSRPFYWDLSLKKNDRGRPLRLNQLRNIAHDSLVEIGSHTLTHRRLSEISTREKWQEIAGSKRLLEQLSSEKIQGFSYPFGSKRDFDYQDRQIIAKAGYNYACTNISGYVFPNSDKYLLPRLIVRDWKLSKFKKYIAEWI